MAEARPRVVVFLRAPRLGRVKTRLAHAVGAAAALRFYRQTALATVRRLAADPTFETVLALVPEPGPRPDPWPPRLRRIAQRGHDLGARMGHALAAVGPGPALVVGSDIPGLEARHVRRALRLLKGADAVIGPAEDGGYWLVGFRRRPLPRGAFHDVRWSGPHARADTLRNLAGIRVAIADMLFDVDDAEALARLGRLTRPAGARAP
jgi:rSAM/selenodomain-associated transferase 1